MDFEGSVYHPKFMDFDLSLEIALQQSKEKSESLSGDNKFRNSYLSSYYFSSDFLRDKPYRFTLFTDKQREVQNRDFFERQTIDRFTYGGSVNLREVFFPLSLSFRRTDEEIDRSFRVRQDFEDETFNLQAEPVIKPLGRVRMDYIRNKFRRQEGNISDQDGTSNSLTFSNRYSFGEAKDKRLASYLRYYSLKGTRDNEDMILDESLTVIHNKSLETFYRYSFSNRSTEGIDSREQDLRIGLKHRLYESLVTSFNLEGILLESTSFDEKSVAVSIDNTAGPIRFL